MKLYKKQAEDAEQIATINLNKFRKLQNELNDAEEKATENQSNRLRNKIRSANTSLTRTTPQVKS
jgi:hypothetical protein